MKVRDYFVARRPDLPVDERMEVIAHDGGNRTVTLTFDPQQGRSLGLGILETFIAHADGRELMDVREALRDLHGHIEQRAVELDAGEDGG